MKAMITGASSGIGRDMAKILSDKSYDLILVARNKEALETLKKELKTRVEIFVVDLSDISKVKELYEKTKNEKIDLLINNAGYGIFGSFDETNLDDELNMIDVNVKALHILTKLYLKDMKKRDSGTILNVASSAAFFPGPLLSSYYASKSYVYKLSLAINEELNRCKSNVKISVLCPGPVATNFNNRAGVTFSVKPLTSYYVADYALKKCLKGKTVIIPSITMKLGKLFSHFVSDKFIAKITYNIQKKKEK